MILVTAAAAAASVLLTGPDAVPPPPRDTVWDRLAACESDGDWHEGDGGLGPHRGGLQWVASTWQAVKPDGAPNDPAEAGRSAEIAAAEKLMDEPWGGWHHWPVCSRRVGLR